MIRLLSLLMMVGLVAFLPTQAHATPITKDQANQYYSNCMSQSDPRLTKPSQQSMCACTSARMMERLTVEDVQTMSGNDQPARDALNKMLVDVYAPCMSDPVRDLLQTECRSNPQVKGANATAICDCVAKLTGDWYSLSGRAIMAEALRQNPNLTDPTEPVTNSPEFKSEAMKNLQSCMQEP